MNGRPSTRGVTAAAGRSKRPPKPSSKAAALEEEQQRRERERAERERQQKKRGKKRKKTSERSGIAGGDEGPGIVIAKGAATESSDGTGVAISEGATTNEPPTESIAEGAATNEPPTESSDGTGVAIAEAAATNEPPTHGASIITKRNIVSATISFVFLVMSSDVPNPRLATSEPAEHTFGSLRINIREFTNLEFAQLVERFTRRLSLMYDNLFCPSRDRAKGYQSTFKNFFQYSVDESEPLMEGTVALVSNGDPVAVQLWPIVGDLIGYASSMIRPLLDSLGVPEGERSPFCCAFASLTDLRDVFIRYLPSTFTYENVSGMQADDIIDDDDSPDSNNNDNGDSQGVVLHRIRQFQHDILSGEDQPDQLNQPTVDVPQNELDTGENEQLFTQFRALMQVTSADDLLAQVLATSLCIEGKGKDTVVGSVSFDRKAKSLLGRWLTKGPGSLPIYDNVAVENEIIIERDVIVLLNVKLGRGAAAANVSLPYRVLNIYGKYYNKWFMSKQPYKKWKREKQPYKLMVRLLDKNVLGEYSDIDFYGGAYGKDNNCRIVTDNMIIDVIGRLNWGVE